MTGKRGTPMRLSFLLNHKGPKVIIRYISKANTTQQKHGRSVKSRRVRKQRDIMDTMAKEQQQRGVASNGITAIHLTAFTADVRCAKCCTSDRQKRNGTQWVVLESSLFLIQEASTMLPVQHPRVCNLERVAFRKRAGGELIDLPSENPDKAAPRRISLFITHHRRTGSTRRRIQPATIRNESRRILIKPT